MNNPPIIKTAREVQQMKAAGQAVASVLEDVKALVRPGVTTGDLNEAARVSMERLKAKPSFLDYAQGGRVAD